MTVAKLEITGIAAGGDGVARQDGLVVFTPRTAPGDQVTVELTMSGRMARGKLLSIESPGPGRVAPICQHYEGADRCGGCQLQHLDLEHQRRAKVQMVQDAFARIAKRAVELPTIEGSEGWRYRRTLTLALRRTETQGWQAGLRAFDDPEAVFSLVDCHLTDVAVLEVWRAVLAASSAFPEESRLRGTVRISVEGPVLILEGGARWPLLQDFLRLVPGLVAVWWQAEGKRRRLIADRRTLGSPGAAFVQVNAEVDAMLREALVSQVMAHEPTTVIDGYSGTGETAVRLAERGVQVAAVELDEEATAWCATRLPAGSRAIAARVEQALPHLVPADVVILNPPRIGVDERVTTLLRDHRPRPTAIFYVSCDPATLARDVSRLSGWRIASLRCYDMFPQTAHVETLCELVPEVG